MHRQRAYVGGGLQAGAALVVDDDRPFIVLAETKPKSSLALPS